MQDGSAGVLPTGVAIQAAVLTEETAEDAAAAAAAIHLMQHMQAEADELPPTGVACGAAAYSDDNSVLPAAEEAAVMTEAAAVLTAAEETAVLTEAGAGGCFGILQTKWLLQTQ